jgi:multicomponent Na+:H+ antiporter subunit C
VNPFLGYALSGVVLIGIGLYGTIVYGHLLRKIIAINVMSSGIFLVFIALARRVTDLTDPVPQAMVITGIVVAVCTSAVALVLSVRIAVGRGQAALSDDNEDSD